MTKLIKSKAKKSRLNGKAKGKIEKPTRKKVKKQNGMGKKKNIDQNGRETKLSKRRSKQVDLEDDEEVKKKPSKADLKVVIDGLKKDATLLLIRKALKYIPYFLKSEGLTKKLLKEIIRLWAEAGEKVRVVCLLCLIRIYTKLKDKERKQQVIKSLYTSFLEKCRITKLDTMSMIGFMRHSLIELYKLDINIAFKQAQSSCQQLTVTLKNACTHKNEETYKTVLNWQFANCLILLSNLITSQDDDSPIKTLTHQVIQLNLGAMNLLSSPRYYPYYCHLIENLIDLSISTNLFIPILPQMVAILDKIQFQKPKSDKKHTKSKNDKEEEPEEEDEEKDVDDDDEEVEDDDDEEHEIKPKAKEYNMDLLNHVSLDEAHSPEYNVAVLEKVYDLMIRYLASQCHKIAFPELVLLPSIQLKKWVKRSPPQHIQKFKILLDKMKSDCDKLEDKRRNADFVFTNFPAVDAWERKMKDSNTLSLPKLITK